MAPETTSSNITEASFDRLSASNSVAMAHFWYRIVR